MRQKGLYVTTMVFNRHDLLRKLFESCAASTRKPDAVYVVDHAYDQSKIRAVAGALDDIPLEVVTLEDAGCAHAANWYFRHIPDDRVGCGDDVSFAPAALEKLAATEGDFIIPKQTLNPAACCLIRNSCVEKIGYFDEKISPQYLYFEDTDFIRRLGLAGIPQTVCEDAEVFHHEGGSQTLAKLTHAQMEEHHIRFRIAAANYVKKWGGPPFEERLTVPREL